MPIRVELTLQLNKELDNALLRTTLLDKVEKDCIQLLNFPNTHMSLLV